MLDDSVVDDKQDYETDDQYDLRLIRLYLIEAAGTLLQLGLVETISSSLGGDFGSIHRMLRDKNLVLCAETKEFDKTGNDVVSKTVQDGYGIELTFRYLCNKDSADARSGVVEYVGQLVGSNVTQKQLYVYCWSVDNVNVRQVPGQGPVKFVCPLSEYWKRLCNAE